MESVEKDPEEILPYGWTWNKWLDDGETISSSSWSVEPTGELTIDSDSNDDTSTTVWLSGGVDNSNYTVKNIVVTSLGKEPVRRLDVRVRLK